MTPPRLTSVGALLLLAAAGLATQACEEPARASPREGTVAVDVAPPTAAVGPSGRVAFTATVTGATSLDVDWSITEQDGGTVDGAGLYTAPAVAGTFHVVAASRPDPTVRGTAVVTVAAAGPTQESASHQGPLPVQSYSSGIPTGANYVNPIIYLPAGAPTPYPGVVFVPGLCELYRQDPETFTQWGTFLASHGFVVMFIDTGSGGCDGGRARALAQGLDALVAESTRAGSALLGKVDPSRLAVMGHSFGGSGALYAAEASTDPRLRAAIALTPVTTDGYYGDDRVPSMILAGAGDPYTSDSGIQYDSIPAGTPKVHARFTETSAIQPNMHHIADTPLGTHPTDPVVARLALSFLQVYVAGDDRYGLFLVGDVSMSNFAWSH